jgi:hypothetical protein
MRLVSAFSLALCAISQASPYLIGGTAADPKDWPASVYAHMSGAACSATVVGEKVLLIATHCVEGGASASFSVGGNAYRAKCTNGPGYDGNATADWSLCLTDKPVTGTAYERILTDTSKIKDGDTVRLTGYGCIRKGGGGGNDGVFRIGTAKVTSTPSGRDYDTVTKGGAALCFGDSGGAAYVEVGKERFIFGVNSRGDIATTSYLSSTYVSAFLDFAKSWMEKTGQKVCGVDPTAAGCRGADVPPPGPTEFAVDSLAASVTGRVKPGFEAKLEAVKMAVKSALDAVK